MLLGCKAVLLGEGFQMLQRNVWPSFSGGQEVPFIWETTLICAIAGDRKANLPAMWSHRSCSEQITKGQNNSIKMGRQKRSKS